MDHYDDHHAQDAGFPGGGGDHDGGDWHHDHHLAMASDDHDLFSRHADHDDDVHHHDEHDDQVHPAGCACCCDAAPGDQESQHGDVAHTDGRDSGEPAHPGHVGSIAGAHPWSHTLGALHDSGHRTTTAEASSSPSPAATSLVPSAPLPSSPAQPTPSGNPDPGNPDEVAITDNNPVFAKLLAENPNADQQTALEDLNTMPPAAAAQVGNMMEHLAAVNSAMVQTWTLPEGVSPIVPVNSTSIDYLAEDGSSHSTSAAAESHNRLG
jgi:hypothetical protein